MFIVKMADHDGNHRCLVEKNVPIALILPSRWQYGAESLRDGDHKLSMASSSTFVCSCGRIENYD